MTLCSQTVFLLFNQTCLNEGVLPNYTYLSIYIYIYIFRERERERLIDIIWNIVRCWGIPLEETLNRVFLFPDRMFLSLLFQYSQFRILPKIQGTFSGIVIAVVHRGLLVGLLVPGKYPWEKYEPPYPPSYGLNCTATVLLGEWLWH